MRNAMRMQEPEQWQSSEQEWQPNQEYGEYRAQYRERDEPIQQQKLDPLAERRLRGRVVALIAIIILSSIGFFLTVAGIVASAIVLQYANGQQALLAGGVIGLISSIGALLMCVAIFVVAVIAIARPHAIRRFSK
jgi:hypothetical protein